MKQFLPAILIFLLACNNSNKTTTEPTQENVTEKDSIEIPKIENIMPEGFSIFENIEQIQYCVPMPSTFYRHDDNADLERGKHIFLRPDDSSAYIEVTGMMRSNESIGILDYFENSYTEDDEAEGKIIEEKKLIEKDRCFYAIGYWSNFPEKKFLEITWFGKEEIVVYYVSDYSVDGQPYWETKIEFLVEFDSKCE